MKSPLGPALSCCAALLLCAACAHPPIAKPLREEARRGVTISEVQANPAAYQGSLVIWGGRVIKTVPTQGGTDLFVLQQPLGSGERPTGGASGGRFIAHSPGFLDPEVYKGRRVTLAGVIESIQSERVGGVEYAYPVLDAKQIVVFHHEPRYSYWGPYEWPYWGPGWGWGGGWWGPDWGEGDEGFGGGFGGEEGEGEGEPGEGEEHEGGER